MRQDVELLFEEQQGKNSISVADAILLTGMDVWSTKMLQTFLGVGDSQIKNITKEIPRFKRGLKSEQVFFRKVDIENWLCNRPVNSELSVIQKANVYILKKKTKVK